MCLSDETAGMVFLSEAEVGLPKVEHERLLAPLQKVLPLLSSCAHLVATA
jgi:hypothetical protein